MENVSEASPLMGGPRSRHVDDEETPGLPSSGSTGRLLWKSVASISLVAAFVLAAGSRTRSLKNHQTSHIDSDHSAFDPIFHSWESELYKRTQIVPPLLGRAKRNEKDGDSAGRSMGKELIYFNHSEAFQMLHSTEPFLAQDFYYYQQGWEAQINQAYCGVASCMAAMNSLRGRISLPQDPVFFPFPWATQLTLIENECVREHLYDIDKMEHRFWGLGLDMATTLLNCNLQGRGYRASAYPVDPKNVTTSKIRSVFQAALKDEDTRLVINYDRGGIAQGQMGHGHFSPIGAYNSEKDAFLIMDVAKYKYPPVWVPTAELLGGIASLDNCAFFNYPEKPFDTSYPTTVIAELLGCKPNYRGYILITKDGD